MRQIFGCCVTDCALDMFSRDGMSLCYLLLYGYGDSLLVLDIKLRVVVDFRHGELSFFMRTNVWIGSRIAAKLCRGMVLRVRFACSSSTVCDEFLASCCGGTGKLAVQLSHLSHFP